MPNQEAPARPDTGEPQGHSLFFAAIPPAEIKAQMARAWQMFGTGEPFRHNTLHLSIHAVAGAVGLDPTLVKRAQQAVSSLRTAPFTLCFERVMTFGGSPDSKALVLATGRASNELNTLAAELHASCRARDLRASSSRKITPHVTLSYGAGFADIRKIDKPIVWTIDEISLIDSLQGQNRHVVLGTWPLPKDREQQGFDF